MGDEKQSRFQVWVDLENKWIDSFKRFKKRVPRSIKGFLSFLFGLVLIILIFAMPTVLTRDISHFVDIFPSFRTTGEIGDTIGGITAPFIGLLAAYLVYISFKKQVEANERLMDIEKQNSKLNAFQTYSESFKVINEEVDSIKTSLDLKPDDPIEKYIDGKSDRFSWLLSKMLLGNIKGNEDVILTLSGLIEANVKVRESFFSIDKESDNDNYTYMLHTIYSARVNKVILPVNTFLTRAKKLHIDLNSDIDEETKEDIFKLFHDKTIRFSGQKPLYNIKWDKGNVVDNVNGFFKSETIKLLIQNITTYYLTCLYTMPVRFRKYPELSQWHKTFPLGHEISSIIQEE